MKTTQENKALTNNGTVAPGNSVGTLVIIGDFISIGTLNMEIEGESSFDRIIVTGNADVTGTMAPEFTMMYTPDPNDDFNLITAATYSGTISTLSVTPASFSCTYNNMGTLEFQMVLPIQLLSFSGQRQEDAIQLNWRTATEQNNDYMAVERAGSDFQFIEIGRVRGVGTTTEPQHYQFLDTAPLDGANYYRLRQVDFDGGTEYHPVIYVDYIETSRAASLQVFPNPAQDRIRAAWQAGNDAPAQLRLFNASGQLLQSFRVNGDNGTYELPVDALSPGIYYLHLNQGNTNEQIRFVKH